MRRQTHSSISTLALVAAAAVAASGAATPASAQEQYANRDSVTVAQLTPLANSDAASSAKATWHSAVASPAKGEVTLTLEQVGTPDDAINPVWPVLVRWAYESAIEPNKSFVAEMFGRGTPDGRMDVRGVITSGYRAGSEVRLSMHTGGKMGKATLRIYPLRAE